MRGLHETRPLGALARELLRNSKVESKARPLQIAIFLYPGVTALDAVGPWEVWSRLPDVEIRFVGKQIGPVPAEGGVLRLGITHTLEETPAPDVVLVPGGVTTPGQMLDDGVIGWLQLVHEKSIWTTSVCTGSLILGAAGLLKGLSATSHWYRINVLKVMGARPKPAERIVIDGKIVTAAGVSAGIDLALWLAGQIAGRERAEAIQLTIEYDPQPPFDAGHMSKASREIRELANDFMDERMPADQRRLVPKIALRRFADLIRTGR